MKIEVLICTHNRADLLKRTLTFINQAILPEGVTFSLLVIANACTDETHGYLDNYQANCSSSGNIPLRFDIEPVAGKSVALNRAIKLVKGDFIAFVDDDHRVDRHYFTAMAASLVKHPAHTIHCGRILPDWTGDEPLWAHDLGPYAIYPLPIPHFDVGQESRELSIEERVPGGGNLVVSRGLFGRVGNFCTDLGPQGHNLGGGEDNEFVIRAASKGETIYYTPDIIQYHYVDLSRLKFHYLLTKSYQRTLTGAKARITSNEGIPLYLWRKLASYGLKVVMSLYWPATRFYLVRCAATLGEISAHRNKRGR